MYIVTDYQEGGPTRTLDSTTSMRLIKEFGFDTVDIVESREFPNHGFVGQIENFLWETIALKCAAMKKPI